MNTHTEILVRQNQMEQDDAGAPARHIADPADGMPILSRTSDYLEFPTRGEAIAFVYANGMTPVFD